MLADRAAHGAPELAGQPKTVPWVSALLLTCLAAQFGLQPFLQGYARDVDARSVVLATELCKAALCFPVVAGWTARSTLRAAPIAGLYILQNLCMQYAYPRLDSLSFNLLNQLKILGTAFWLFVLKRQCPSRRQLLALSLLSAAGLVLAVTGEVAAVRSSPAESTAWRSGVAACLSASMLSGLASVATQLHFESGHSSAALTFELSMVAVPVLSAGLVTSSGGVAAAFAHARSGWTTSTLLPVAFQACGGVLVGLVVARLGALSKGVATVGGLVLTGVVQAMLQGSLRPELILATGLVALSIRFSQQTNYKSKIR